MMNSRSRHSPERVSRVQIDYDVEMYGRQHSVELPFVMGVMADLSGHGAAFLPPLDERQLLDIDATDFDHRIREIGARLNLRIPDHLTGEGLLDVDLSFGRIDDFRPDAVARQVPALARLLRAREQLALLLTYMDGKAGAEQLLNRLIRDRELLAATAGDEPDAGERPMALASDLEARA
jgi:type VI secretion system protein ImpB